MRTELLVRNKEDVIILEEREITFEQLSGIFLQNTYNTVYVTRDRVLSGIITLGNFRRHQLQGRDLINHKFTVFLLQDEDKILDFFRDNKKINAVPVLDEGGNIVKEYYRKMPLENIDFDNAIDVCCGMEYMLTKYDFIYFVVSCLSKQEKQRAEVFSKSYQERMQIVEFFPLTALEDSHNIFVCDFSAEHFRIGEVLYNKYNIDYIKYNLDVIYEQEVKNSMQYLVKLYENVAVAGDDFFTEMIREVHTESLVLDTGELSWNAEENCYEYLSEIPKGIECIFMTTYFYGRVLFKQNKCYVPTFMCSQAIASIFLFSQEKVGINIQGCRNKFQIQTVASEFDIIYNIIPKLQLGGVECVVIEDHPKRKTHNIFELLPQGVLHKFGDEFDRSGNDDGDEYKPSQDYIQFLVSDNVEQVAGELLSVKWIAPKGIRQIADISGKYVNYKGGERFTVGNPEEYRNTLYLFGPCLVRGSHVEDACTIGSFLRKEIDNDFYIKNLGSAWFSMNLHMREEKYKTGDVVIIFSFLDKYKNYYKENNIKTYSIDNAYLRVPDLQNNIWDDLFHCNRIVTKEIADELLQILHKVDAFRSVCFNKIVQFGIERMWLELPRGLEKWLQKASVHKSNQTVQVQLL